jgi:hypothetical protein
VRDALAVTWALLAWLNELDDAVAVQLTELETLPLFTLPTAFRRLPPTTCSALQQKGAAARSSRAAVMIFDKLHKRCVRLEVGGALCHTTHVT